MLGGDPEKVRAGQRHEGGKEESRCIGMKLLHPQRPGLCREQHGVGGGEETQELREGQVL